MSYRSWTQQQLGNEFNQMHVGMDLKRNLVPQFLQDFVKIIQYRDDLKEVKRTKEECTQRQSRPF